MFAVAQSTIPFFLYGLSILHLSFHTETARLQSSEIESSFRYYQVDSFHGFEFVTTLHYGIQAA